MTFYSVGIRRKKDGVVLDVLYPTIRTDSKQLSELESLVSVKKNSVTELSIHDYFKCRIQFSLSCHPMLIQIKRPIRRWILYLQYATIVPYRQTQLKWHILSCNYYPSVW